MMISRRLTVLLAILIFSVYLLYNKNLVIANYRSWQYGSTELSLDLKNIERGLSESQIKQRYASLPLNCWKNHDEKAKLGHRVCYTELKSYNGLAASFIAFFFRDGQLSSLKIDIPWRLHRTTKRQLIQQYGRPLTQQLLPIHGARLMGWNLDQGALFFNLDPHINPLQWNTIFWISADETERIGGAFIKNSHVYEGNALDRIVGWLFGISSR